MRGCKSEAESAVASCKDLGVSQFTHISYEGTDLFGHSRKRRHVFDRLCINSLLDRFLLLLAIKMMGNYIFSVEISADPPFLLL